MPKLIWEKKLQEAVKRQQRFGWSVRDKRGKVLLQRYYPDINKKVLATILFRYTYKVGKFNNVWIKLS